MDDNKKKDGLNIELSRCHNWWGIESSKLLRKSNDIDFFVSDRTSVKVSTKDFEEHDSELKYHLIDKEDLIFNPKYHFIYNSLKIISFEQLYKI